MFKQYKDKVDFKVVYIREAHPTDGWQVRANERDGVLIASPKNDAERAAAATACAKNLKICIPILIDNLQDEVERVYAGWPDRLYVIDQSGKIAYKGAPGPAGFKPKEAESVLRRLLGL